MAESAPKPAPKAKAKAKDNRADCLAKIKEAMETQHISAEDGKAICRMKFGAKSTADLNDSELKDLAENIVNYGRKSPLGRFVQSNDSWLEIGLYREIATSLRSSQ